MAGLVLLASTAYSADKFSRGKTMIQDGAWRPIVAKSSVIFSISVREATPLFDVDDMPTGHNPWRIKARVIKTYKGAITAAPGSEFETRMLIYQGPVRKKPQGLWINVIPRSEEIWAVFCGPAAQNKPPEEILRGLGEGCFAVSLFEQVERELDR